MEFNANQPAIYENIQSKYPKVDINTKEKFIESLLTQHCTSHTFNITLENAR